MPFPSNAIRGEKSLTRKRERLAREAEQEFSSLPDWMFWEKKRMDQHIEKADITDVLKTFGEFVRLMLRSTKHYEERDKE